MRSAARRRLAGAEPGRAGQSGAMSENSRRQSGRSDADEAMSQDASSNTVPDGADGPDDWDLPAVPVLGADNQLPCPDITLATSREGFSALLQDFAEWVREQKLPEAETADGHLVKFLHSCNYDLEQAKACIKAYHSCREQFSDLFSGWDVDLPSMQSSSRHVVAIAVLPRKTPDNRRIVVSALRTPDTSKYVFLDAMRLLLMTYETILHTEPTLSGVIAINDMAITGFGHFLKFSVSTLHNINEYMTTGMPLIQSDNHLVNSSFFIEKGLSLLRSIGRKEDWARLHVHRGNDLARLHSLIPQRCLPSDLGGTLPSIQELSHINLKRLADFKEIFKRSLPSR